MDKPIQDSGSKKTRSAHANFRKGLSDYNDGENVTHHLGNDDFDGQNIKDVEELNNPRLDGKVAEGNDLIEDDDDVDYTEYQVKKDNDENKRELN